MTLADRFHNAVDALAAAKRERGLDDRVRQTYKHLVCALDPAKTRWLYRAQKELGPEAVCWGFAENISPKNSSAFILRAALRGFLAIATPFEGLTADRIHEAMCAAENVARHEVEWRYGIDGGRGCWRGYESPNETGIVAALGIMSKSISFNGMITILESWLGEQDQPDKGSMALLILLKGFRG